MMPPIGGSVRPWSKVLVVMTEDRFALSHCIPLLTELKALADTVVVAAGSTGRLGEVGALGVEPLAFDMKPGSRHLADLREVRDGLARLIEALRPDAVHAVGLRPMAMASLALRSAGLQPPAVILHLTGRGYLGYARTLPAYLMRRPRARSDPPLRGALQRLAGGRQRAVSLHRQFRALGHRRGDPEQGRRRQVPRL